MIKHMKEIIVTANSIESIKLIDDGKGHFKLKNEFFDYKKEERNKNEPLSFDMNSLIDLRKTLNDIIPKPKNNPLVIPKEDIKTIADSDGIISLGELARYLNFDDVQNMIDLLPNNVKVTVIGNDLRKAVIKVSELTKFSNTTDLREIKTTNIELNSFVL